MTSNVAQDQASTEQKQSDKEYNFAQVRKQAEQADRRAQEAERRAAEAERRISEIERAAEERNASHVEEDSTDPYVDHKVLEKKLVKRESEQDKKYEKKIQEGVQRALEQDRNAQFVKQNPDFYQILTPDLLEKFAEKHPDLAESLQAMPDGFERQKLVYKNIKALGVHLKEAPKIQETINSNRRHPGLYQGSQVGASPYSSNSDFSQSGQKTAYDKMKDLQSRLRL